MLEQKTKPSLLFLSPGATGISGAAQIIGALAYQHFKKLPRHGETSWNRQKILSGPNIGGKKRFQRISKNLF